jgi:hypothetical protein
MYLIEKENKCSTFYSRYAFIREYSYITTDFTATPKVSPTDPQGGSKLARKIPRKYLSLASPVNNRTCR